MASTQVTTSQVASLAEFVRDTIGAALVQGTGVTVTVDDAGDTITIASAGSGTLTVQDENGTVGTAVTQIDFQGAGVTATAGTGEIVVTIPGRSPVTVNAQTGTGYTLVLGDAGAFVTMTNASASTLTVPPNSSVAFPVGTLVEGAQRGAGQVTLTPGSGVTLNATPGLKVAAQYGTFGLLKVATDVWLAFGRLAA